MAMKRSVPSAAIGLGHLVDHRDVRVVESRGGARLAEEAVTRLGVRVHLPTDRLEGHPSLEAEVVGEVDVSHAALAEALEDPVVGNRLSDHEKAIIRPARSATEAGAEEVPGVHVGRSGVSATRWAIKR